MQSIMIIDAHLYSAVQLFHLLGELCSVANMNFCILTHSTVLKFLKHVLIQFYEVAYTRL